MKVNLSLLNHSVEDIEFNELFKNHEQTILYFYPKDGTPWCTIEAKDFSDNYAIFRKHNIWVVTWTIRSTFLLDKKWNIIKERKNVKADNHVQNIISILWIK